MAFILQVSTYRGDDCVLWPFACYTNGYGNIHHNGKKIPASRLMCHVAHGNPPTPRHEAAHSCRNAKFGCITPNHLRWATHAENLADRITHGTANRGERHGLSRLTNPQVLLAVELIERGHSQSAIAARLRVGQGAIHRIHVGVCWGWLTGRGQ